MLSASHTYLPRPLPHLSNMFAASKVLALIAMMCLCNSSLATPAGRSDGLAGRSIDRRANACNDECTDVSTAVLLVAACINEEFRIDAKTLASPTWMDQEAHLAAAIVLRANSFARHSEGRGSLPKNVRQCCD